MYLVVNEWLPEYFLREANNEQKGQLEAFLNRFLARNDVLYVQVGSPFETKIHKFAKDNQQYPTCKNIKQFIGTVLRDSQRCVLVKDKPALPQKIENK